MTQDGMRCPALHEHLADSWRTERAATAATQPCPWPSDPEEREGERYGQCLLFHCCSSFSYHVFCRHPRHLETQCVKHWAVRDVLSRGGAEEVMQVIKEPGALQPRMEVWIARDKGSGDSPAYTMRQRTCPRCRAATAGVQQLWCPPVSGAQGKSDDPASYTGIVSI